MTFLQLFTSSPDTNIQLCEQLNEFCIKTKYLKFTVIPLGQIISNYSKLMLTLTEDTFWLAGCNNTKWPLEDLKHQPDDNIYS
jgi:hypothetical protein